jgi:hypothetical protein
MYRVLEGEIPQLDEIVPGISPTLAAAVARATSKDQELRFATALDFALELERCAPLIPARVVGDWVREVGGHELARRGERLREIESTPISRRAPSPSEPDSDAVPSHVPSSPDDPTRSDVGGARQEPRPRTTVGLWSAALAALALAAGVGFWQLSARSGAAAAAHEPAPLGPAPSASEAPAARTARPQEPAQSREAELLRAMPSAQASTPPARASAAPPERPARPAIKPKKRPEDLFSRE